MKKWTKVGITYHGGNRTIVYHCEELPGICIESRKKAIRHSNGDGVWYHTSYFVTRGKSETEYWTLKEAKEAAEKQGRK